MDHAELVRYCLAKPGAVADEPWEGDLVAKVGGKIFAFLGTESVGLKCGRDRLEADELVRIHPDEVTPSAYIGRYGWNAVRIDGGISDNELRELIDYSYEEIVRKLPKSKRP
ncbi:MmcQ/YjbR family DNA-binding protein [Nocardia farcinica]|uniref:Uncharacterized protein conserved in bacteria n=1 Tax=Nocardia farcinica TaxID=37329 RepID=A0A0H5NSS0_NOCFR|nr:MmcQ/YjbR family DNA-binding protein [Nocardia farcinica]AXK85933.1 hypothetical protein DXT66_10120 [Nocardia farcinica]MBA4859331.1 MmcQ/YjbR family DNA-binding protein [Nocardia farcinica]MBC9816135.1 MmcQ/YjbR family DNA-binding protein [Nocardia farcinica]MBF6068276.1 MmcQ/YjbR family DNA-binding protein [Nocardia farcinica]MBF6231605.1 MmcQ/YjbR family DNA-binding protein [Nocardia farcinica]